MHVELSPSRTLFLEQNGDFIIFSYFLVRYFLLREEWTMRSLRRLSCKEDLSDFALSLFHSFRLEETSDTSVTSKHSLLIARAKTTFTDRVDRSLSTSPGIAYNVRCKNDIYIATGTEESTMRSLFHNEHYRRWISFSRKICSQKIKLSKDIVFIFMREIHSIAVIRLFCFTLFGSRKQHRALETCSSKKG